MDSTLIIAHIVTEPLGDGFMHKPFFEGTLFGNPVILYPWKIIGYFGVAMFGCRWLPQFFASRKAKAVTMPRIFWVMSVVGSLSLLSYFLFGKMDSVGIFANALPCLVASYNLYLDLKRSAHPDPPASEA